MKHHNDRDVTEKVGRGRVDDELLPIDECVCGQKFGAWNAVLSIYRDTPFECFNCGRRMYFSNKITVWEVVDNEEKA